MKPGPGKHLAVSPRERSNASFSIILVDVVDNRIALLCYTFVTGRALPEKLQHDVAAISVSGNKSIGFCGAPHVSRQEWRRKARLRRGNSIRGLGRHHAPHVFTRKDSHEPEFQRPEKDRSIRQPPLSP